MDTPGDDHDDANGYETIIYGVDADTATITLNRPAKLNAWTPKMG